MRILIKFLVCWFFSSIFEHYYKVDNLFYSGGCFSMLPLLQDGFGDFFSLPGMFLVFLFSLYYFWKLHMCRLMRGNM